MTDFKNLNKNHKEYIYNRYKYSNPNNYSFDKWMINYSIIEDTTYEEFILRKDIHNILLKEDDRVSLEISLDHCIYQ